MNDPQNYRPNYCNVNVDKFIKQNGKGEIFGGFKLYRVFEKQNPVGYKAIVHFVVSIDGSYVDPTPDDSYVFVPSSKVPSMNKDKYHRRGVVLSAVVYGSEAYKSWVSGMDEYKQYGLQTVHRPEDLKMLITHKRGDHVKLTGLSRAEFNGKYGTLSEYDSLTDRWGVSVDGVGLVGIKHNNILPTRPPELYSM